jgi:predicted deacylase
VRRFRGMVKHDLPRTRGEWGQARVEFRMVHSTAEPVVDARVRVGHGREISQIAAARKRESGATRAKRSGT